MLNDHDAAALLEIAREAIIKGVKQQLYSPSPREEKALNQKSGCFVTIKQNNMLRGCIGNFQARQPLFREVGEMAKASACQDPRFPPMAVVDLANFKLEITVLSPLQKIDDTELIQVGEHGIYIEKGLNRGVLLPQVATEQGWDRKTFLEQTCRKAGLPAEAWQSPDADIYLFSGQLITEKD